MTLSADQYVALIHEESRRRHDGEVETDVTLRWQTWTKVRRTCIAIWYLWHYDYSYLRVSCIDTLFYRPYVPPTLLIQYFQVKSHSGYCQISLTSLSVACICSAPHLTPRDRFRMKWIKTPQLPLRFQTVNPSSPNIQDSFSVLNCFIRSSLRQCLEPTGTGIAIAKEKSHVQ